MGRKGGIWVLRGRGGDGSYRRREIRERWESCGGREIDERRSHIIGGNTRNGRWTLANFDIGPINELKKI